MRSPATGRRRWRGTSTLAGLTHMEEWTQPGERLACGKRNRTFGARSWPIAARCPRSTESRDIGAMGKRTIQTFSSSM
jgi:hypothetical protein